MQFHVKYVTPEPKSTTWPKITDREDGFCIIRKQYDVGGTSGYLSEGRVSVAMKTATDDSQLYYSAVTLSDSDGFQEGVSGEVWDEKFARHDCGRYTGIAVFQAMLYHTLLLCENEHKKTAKMISEVGSVILP